MFPHCSLKCQESYRKDEGKPWFLFITVVKHQEKTERVNLVPALRESYIHQGAKLAAHSDTVCIQDFKKTLCKWKSLNATVSIVWPYIIPVVLAR